MRSRFDGADRPATHTEGSTTTEVVPEKGSSLKPKTKLSWGETPWDDLSHEDLLRVAQRFFSALTSAHSVLRTHHAMGGGATFWSSAGTGGPALAKTTQALAPYEDGGPYREAIYRRFFRVADDLRFDGLGHGWHVCDECGCMISGEGTPQDCPDCAYKDRVAKPMRPVAWVDLTPRQIPECSPSRGKHVPAGR